MGEGNAGTGGTGSTGDSGLPKPAASAQGGRKTHVDPKLLAAARGFLQFYIFGDGKSLGFPPAQGVRRRRPGLQGPPPEYEPLHLDLGPSEDPSVALLDMSGLEDFVLLDGDDHATLVLFWCTDYPRSALRREAPRLSSKVKRVELATTMSAHVVGLECYEKLETFLGDHFAQLGLEYHIEFLPFEELAARKAEILSAGTALPLP